MKRHTAVSLAATFTLLCCSILPVGAYDMDSPEEPLRLSAGLSHTVYVDETGTLWAWGSNQAGQLGTETQETSTDLEGNPIPYASQPLAVMEDVVSASAGADFTVALKADGTLWTWGGNDEGQLGTGTTEGSATPVQVLDQVTAVVAGDYHVAALRIDGTLWTWGDNLYGQLGDGTYTSRPTPAQVMEGVTTVAAGVGATAAIRTDNTLWTWGDNLFGQLGDGTQDSRPTPQQILTDVSAVNLGGYHAAAIRTDGTLWMWGSNIDGQLGTGQATEVLQTQPIQVPLNGAVLAVAAGTGHTVAILEDGSLWVWGRNDQGQLGWTRDHGYAEVSSFPFPPLYLGDDLAQLAEEDPDLAPFLHQCLLQFVNHEYGHLSSLDLVENFLNRDVHQKSTWMRGNYPSPRWGEIRLEIFYDMGLFHREDTAPRALALEQSRKEKATRPEENP